MNEIAVYPDLRDRAVLITGGASGIGAALVRGFAAQGSRVAFLDVAEEDAQETVALVASETGNRPLFLRCDLRDVEAIEKAAATARAAHGDATVLVNNAARDDRHEIEDVTADYWDANQAINLRPHFFTAKAVLPGMKAAGRGSIINFTSTSFMMNMGDMPSYTAAKAGIIGLTKGLAGKLGPHGIRVNAIAPGWVMTERQRALWVTPEAISDHVAHQSIRDEMRPDDIVGPCLFLASDSARMLTAQVLIVDGGYL